MLLCDSRNTGKIKPALGRACVAVRHKNKSGRKVSDIIIGVWCKQKSPEFSCAFNQTSYQDILVSRVQSLFKIACNSLFEQDKGEYKFMLLLYLRRS